MPHILYTLDFTPPKSGDENPNEPKGWYSWSVMIRKLYEQLARVLNGLVSFGNGTTRDNIDGEWATVVDTGLADTDFTVTHNLLRPPVGFILMTTTLGGVVYKGSVAWTDTTITLKDTVANDSILIFVV
jgi:hypothetical protein